MNGRPRESWARFTFPDGTVHRLTFVEGESGEDATPTVFVYGKRAAYGGWHRDRYGDRLGRDWIRAWAADSAPGAAVGW